MTTLGSNMPADAYPAAMPSEKFPSMSTMPGTVPLRAAEAPVVFSPPVRTPAELGWR